MPDKFDDPFPPESLKDRGQLCPAEYEAWEHYLYIQLEEEIAQSYPMSSWNSGRIENYKRRKSEYEDSGFNFEEHKPLGFGTRKCCWFAVKSSDIIGVINSLSGNFLYEGYKIEHAEFREYPGARKPIWNPNDGYYLVLPPSDGTIFVRPRLGKIMKCWHNGSPTIGDYLGAMDPKWAEISQLFGNVYFFSTSTFSQFVGILKWEKGILQTAVSSTQLKFEVMRGTKFPDRYLSERLEGAKYLPHYKFIEFANDHNANSSYIRPLCPGERAYYWLVDI